MHMESQYVIVFYLFVMLFVPGARTQGRTIQEQVRGGCLGDTVLRSQVGGA